MEKMMSRPRADKLHLPAVHVEAELPQCLFDVTCSPQEACDHALALLHEGANVRLDVIATAAEMLQEVQNALLRFMLKPVTSKRKSRRLLR